MSLNKKDFYRFIKDLEILMLRSCLLQP